MSSFNPLIITETYSILKILINFTLSLLFNPIRENERITIYNIYNQIDNFRNNFPTYNSQILNVNKRRFVRRAKKRLVNIKYIDTITCIEHKMPVLKYRDYKKHIKSTPPW